MIFNQNIKIPFDTAMGRSPKDTTPTIDKEPFCLSEAVCHDIKENDRTQPAGYRKGLSFRLGVDTSAHGCANVA